MLKTDVPGVGPGLHQRYLGFLLYWAPLLALLLLGIPMVLFFCYR